MSIKKAAPKHYQERANFKECCIYQVYPASFCDSNGNGIGDIQGMISKLDYLKDLGVVSKSWTRVSSDALELMQFFPTKDVVWLSPIYKSPLIDMGYDISDFQEINPQFGTLSDVDELISQMHKRDMKLVMDLVVNHTSDQHLWFEESRKSKDNRREEFSNGSAWEWDEHTQEYYLQ